jgi:hypothetical protein
MASDGGPGVSRWRYVDSEDELRRAKAMGSIILMSHSPRFHKGAYAT